MRLIPKVRYSGVTAAAADPSTFPIASPWNQQDLQRIVFEDIFGSDIPLNTRASAMRIPAIARGRNLLCTAAARARLVGLKVDQQIPTPSWVTQAGGGQSPALRMVWTIDDLIFYGWSCWWRENGADRFPLNYTRLNQDEWRINSDSRVEVNGVAVKDSDVTLIPGFHGGILDHGKDAIRDAKALYRNVASRVATPLPGLELHQTGGVQLTPEERSDMIAEWATARQGGNAGVAYTSKDIEAKPMAADDDGRLMIESRNAAAVDLARTIGIGASLIDATAPKASLNYETTELRNQEFVDRDLVGYLAPIEARLSLDDVSPHGTRIAFDLSDIMSATPSPTGPTQED